MRGRKPNPKKPARRTASAPRTSDTDSTDAALYNLDILLKVNAGELTHEEAQKLLLPLPPIQLDALLPNPITAESLPPIAPRTVLPIPTIEAPPPPPTHLDAEARAEWQRITPELLAIGLLPALDRAALASYCSAWSRAVRAEHELAKTGPVVKSPSGFPIQNPWLGILNTAIKQMQSLLAELGLSPTARARLTDRIKKANR